MRGGINYDWPHAKFQREISRENIRNKKGTETLVDWVCPTPHVFSFVRGEEGAS